MILPKRLGQVFVIDMAAGLAQGTRLTPERVKSFGVGQPACRLSRGPCRARDPSVSAANAPNPFQLTFEAPYRRTNG
ncbi:MAG: hypothetical protein U0Q18_33170 [Bryobacteraceae bacterium]